MKPPRRVCPDRERPGPGPDGPHGLRQWVSNFHDHWKSGYRAALKLGHPADIVILATPHNDRTNTPPEGFGIYTRAEVSRLLPTLAVSLMSPAVEGMFFFVATRRFGRLKGSFLGMGQKPTDAEDLPPVPVAVRDSDVGVLV